MHVVSTNSNWYVSCKISFFLVSGLYFPLTSLFFLQVIFIGIMLCTVGLRLIAVSHCPCMISKLFLCEKNKEMHVITLLNTPARSFQVI